MKTLFYPAYGRLEISDRPEPAPARDEAVLRVAACGLCGSELETFKNRSPRRRPPLIMGHEFCGTVVARGRDVRGFATGEKVVGNSLVCCGQCQRCARGDTNLCARRQILGMHRDGAFAEFVTVPARGLLSWPQKLPAVAACLAEPLANGVHMVNLTRNRKPRSVLVLGAGPIGLMAQQAFQVLLSCRIDMVDLSDQRLEIALGLGARRVINPRAVDPVRVALESTGGEGFDLVVDAVGSQVTKKQSLAATRPGGAVVWIGLHEDTLAVNSYDITLAEKTIFGTYSATLDEVQQSLDLIANGSVDVTSWVRTFPLDHGVEAFQRMLEAKGSDIKAVLIP